jgi:hypothetical protein
MRLLACAGCLAALAAIGEPSHRRDPSNTKQPDASVKDVRWLAGCLEARTAGRLIEEARLDVRAGNMLGMGRTTTPKRLMDYELTLIRQQKGKLVYEAHPSGQAPTIFTARIANSDSVIFAAPEHDYPQIVGYRRVGADSVTAWIDGTVQGIRRRIEFPYRRVPCPDGRESR